MNKPTQQKNILLAIGGFQPQIITQALYYFNIHKKVRIDEVVIISTITTYKSYYNGYSSRNTPVFLGKKGKLAEFFNEYCLPSPILKEVKIEDEAGNLIEQLKTSKEYDAAALTILRVLRDYDLGENDNIFCIYAGGQRVLASYLMASLVLVGDNRHHLLHVQLNVNDLQESPEFFFPPKKSVNIKNLVGEIINTEDVKIFANEINFPRLGIKYSGVIRNDTNYKSIIDHIQDYISAEQKPIRITNKDIKEPPTIIGNSKKLNECLGKIKKFALAGFSPLMLYGETGTGKELFADYYHYWFQKSQNKKTQFVIFNCGAIPEGLIESELFGHGKGAFTGASDDHIGHLTNADGGVAFLDEVNSAPHAMQAKLLRFIETGEIQITGKLPNSLKDKTVEGQLKVNVKLISALNENAELLVKNRELRQDLYFRLVKGKINIPPLRERKEDIPELVRYFIEQSCLKYKKPKISLSGPLMKKLIDVDWVGNIRDLRGYIERMVVLAEPDENGLVSEYNEIIEGQALFNSMEISHDQILEAISGPEHQNKNYESLIEDYERWILTKIFSKNSFNAAKTAKELGLAPSTLKDKLKKYSLS